MMTFFCPNCGYNLTGLPENRCPECGREFDPAQLAQQRRADARIGGVILRVLLVPAALPPDLQALVPALCVIWGVVVGSMIDHMKSTGEKVLILTSCAIGLGLLIFAIVTSKKVARRLALTRAIRRGDDHSGLQDRAFILICGIGLFCCQGILSAAGFFGGCAAGVLATLDLR